MKVFQFRTESGFTIIWVGLGSHFEMFLVTLGDILVLWKGPGTTVEFHGLQDLCGATQILSTAGVGGELHGSGAE